MSGSIDTGQRFPIIVPSRIHLSREICASHREPENFGQYNGKL